MTSLQRPGLRRGRRSAPSILADPATIGRALDKAAAHFTAGRLDASAQIYRRLERDAPRDVRAVYSLAVIDIGQGRLERARRRLETAVGLDPTLVQAHHNLGAVCQRQGDWPQAAQAYARAVDLHPEAPASRLGLAAALTALGRAVEAIAQLRLLAQDPTQNSAALTRIALIDPSAISDADLSAMREAAGDEKLDPNVRTGLLFALGDAFDHRGREGEAFAAYAAGNRLKRGLLDVHAAAEANAAAAQYVRDHIGAAWISAHTGHGDSSVAPIFIVGMPRCGSTLIEQILASHPLIQGLGETGVLPRLVGDGYPQTATGLGGLAEQYLTGLRARGWAGASRFVDKTLENYLHLGLIQVLFPRATIIHVQRDPVDVGFACFRQLFTEGNETLYDLMEIGQEYVRYRQLVDHWKAVMPGRIAEIGYEALVGDPPSQIRALVTEVADLPWDERVLRFQEREGGVTTASSSQVRRAIYGTSVRRWRRYADHLQPLISALGVYAGHFE